MLKGNEIIRSQLVSRMARVVIVSLSATPYVRAQTSSWSLRPPAYGVPYEFDRCPQRLCYGGAVLSCRINRTRLQLWLSSKFQLRSSCEPHSVLMI